MAHSNFDFLEQEFPFLFNVGRSAEMYYHTDPAVCIGKLRLWAEQLTSFLFHEHQLIFPSDNTLHHRIKLLELEGVLPAEVKALLVLVKNRGNAAVHANTGTVKDAEAVLSDCFKIAKWFFEAYGTSSKNLATEFTTPVDIDPSKALKKLEEAYLQLEQKWNDLLSKTMTPDRAEEKKKRSFQAARKIDMSEADTRALIDEQLRQAGWEADTNQLNYKLHKTVPKRGKNIAIAEWKTGDKWADYALFIGKELYGIVEAKKYAEDISTNLTQAKRYAEQVQVSDKLQLLGKWGQYNVPFLFSSNGRPFLKQIETKSGIWFLDTRRMHNISRPLQGWYSPEGLKKLFEQNIEDAEKKLSDLETEFLQNRSGLNLRDYQVKAIKAIEEKLLHHPDDRRALVAMATGTGKTRTIIGLCYRLIKTNRFKRILFLVDRTLLGIQALNAFDDIKIIDGNTFGETNLIADLKEVKPDKDTRLHFATVQGMVKRILYADDDADKPAVDAYDCIIIDEAHRGYIMDRELYEGDLEFRDQRDYISKYRMVIDYFDAYAIGMTATPALHTQQIFGDPVYTYSYREAVLDGVLVDHDPPFTIKTKLSEEGIKWEKGEKPQGYDKEANQLIELDELEDELAIDVSGFNKLVITESFNRTVMTELVRHIDPDGEAKTLIFAATDEHADLIVQLLKEAYLQQGIEIPDDAVQKITAKSYDPDEQVKRYRNEKYPNIAVTVDLLTTGIDIPSISNLVFMRRVKSRILYEQMLGRATRICPDIGKESFRIFDAVRIYEALEDFTQMHPVAANPATTFVQLREELGHIDNLDRTKKQIEQIIAKIQRKKRHVTGDEETKFRYQSGGNDPDEFIRILRTLPVQEGVQKVLQLTGLWKYLDELRPAPPLMLVSDHKDEYRTTERGYGNGQKPQDYLDSFRKFILENQNRMLALSIICTRPKELDRKSLRELLLQLDAEGYNPRFLRTAWKDARNEDIAADIISYIRTLVVGTQLISHEERIRKAMKTVRAMRNWNQAQLNWLERFEKQLLAETVLRAEDLDNAPFKDAGGFQRLDKIFEHQLQHVIDTINEQLYKEPA